MAKRKTPLQNIIQFFMTADESAVRAAQEAIKGVIDGRSDLKPSTPSGKRRGRKPRQPDLPVDQPS